MHDASSDSSARAMQAAPVQAGSVIQSAGGWSGIASPDTALAAADIKIRAEDLWVRFAGEHGMVPAVRGVSFTLGAEKLAIVGESGSGKSTIGRAILKLHPSTARIDARRFSFRGIDLLDADEKAMRGIRGGRISMIMQDPKYSLNPVRQLGDQIAEAYRAHHHATAAQAREKVMAMLERVRIRDPLRTSRLYPHQISGGMGQRVMIAMMLITEPEVVIADEPTSALDVSVRADVLQLLDELVADRQIGLLFICHDLHQVRQLCDRILVMYAGQVVESLRASELERARHPYTLALLDAQPDALHRRTRLPVLQRDAQWMRDIREMHRDTSWQ